MLKCFISLSHPHFSILIIASGNVNLPPIFTQDMNNLALSETTPVNSTVYRLEGYDPEGGNVTFGLDGTDNFEVNPVTGDVKLTKQLDREVRRRCQQVATFTIF
jgi:Cadherin domain